MTKKKAIKILNQLILEKKSENSLTRIRSYIIDFFGPESPEYRFINKFTFTYNEIIVEDAFGTYPQ